MEMLTLKAETQWMAVQGLKVAATAAFSYGCATLGQLDRKVVALTCALWQATRAISTRVLCGMTENKFAKNAVFIVSEMVVNISALKYAERANIISSFAAKKLTSLSMVVTIGRSINFAYSVYKAV